jgi:hypothetical protein
MTLGSGFRTFLRIIKSVVTDIVKLRHPWALKYRIDILHFTIYFKSIYLPNTARSFPVLAIRSTSLPDELRVLLVLLMEESLEDLLVTEVLLLLLLLLLPRHLHH